MAIRAVKHVPSHAAAGAPCDGLTLEAHDRYLRRKLIRTTGGLEVMVDLPLPVFIEDGDRLALEDGRSIEIRAAIEDLYEVRGVNPAHVVRLAWQIGNRHIPAQLESDRILIRRDPVLRDMLRRLNATVGDVTEAFNPAQGAYAGHGLGTHGH